MKVVSTEALTKLIQLVKSTFIKVNNTVQTQEVTLADVATSGDYNDLTNKPDLSAKANVDLSNITNTGKNIANWSTNVSNCITEIPQDIKLELNNGTVTLKAGSKVYIPNGFEQDGTTLKFDEVVIESNRTYRAGYGDKRFMFLGTSLSIDGFQIENCFSGSSAPSKTTYMYWYDTTNNILKRTIDGGSTWVSGYSLPICILSGSNGVVNSIDQVFNGFGYIGKRNFITNVRLLIAKGYNTDGTYHNQEYIINSPIVARNDFGNNSIMFLRYNSGSYQIYNIGKQYYLGELDYVPNVGSTFQWYYNTTNRMWYMHETGEQTWRQVDYANIGINTSTETDFKEVFRVVDCNDLATVATTGDYDDLTNKPNSLINTATGQYSLTINGKSTSQRRAYNIGTNSSSLAYGVAYGDGADAGEFGVSIGYTSDCNSYGVALGYNAHTGLGSIQIGYGTNSQSMTMAVGFFNGTSSYEYQLLDGTTGLIPSGRLPVDNSSITINSNGQLQATPERNIGEIIQSILPLTDAGLHLLDGALISGSGSYASFVTYIAGLVSSYPSAFTTESAWQNTVSSKGVCGKFVYNSTNNTVRLPKITGFIEGTTDTTALGELINAGLPNITGETYSTNSSAASHYANTYRGVFRGRNTTGYSYYGGNPVSSSDTNVGISFDASRSSSIYGKSNTVQPQSIKVLYYIVIATSTKTDIQVDIDKIATDLNGKADDNAVVHKSGNETISGPKTFTNTVFAPASGVTNSIVTTTGISKSQNGYVKLGNGIIIQWGSIGNAGSGTITFPTAFTSTNYTITFIGIWNSVGVTYTRETANTTSVFYRCNRSDVSGRWLAIGY